MSVCVPVRFPGARVTDGCELPWWVLGTWALCKSSKCALNELLDRQGRSRSRSRLKNLQVRLHSPTSSSEAYLLKVP